MKAREFWSRCYVGENRPIPLASRNGETYLWMRKSGDWLYLADRNGDFRAVKEEDNMFQIIIDWLNSIKAGGGITGDFLHEVIPRNIAFDKSAGRWTKT